MTRLVRAAALLLCTVLLGGLLTATLVRVAPGFGMDPRESDTRLNAESLRALRAGSAAEQHILPYYLHYLRGMLRGDLGVSRSWGQPVAGLLRERVPVTARAVAFGVMAGWGAGLALLCFWPAVHPGSWSCPAAGSARFSSACHRRCWLCCWSSREGQARKSRPRRQRPSAW